LPGIGLFNRWLWRDTIAAAKNFATASPCVLGIGKPSELALQLLTDMRVERSFYDAMDDFPAFYLGVSRKAMLKRESLIVSKVSRLVVSSTALLNRWRAHRKDVVLSLNGCAVGALPPTTALPGPSSAHVLGYVGTIGEWFDWDIVFKLAQAVPLLRIRLIGPAVVSLPDKIPNNVEIIGRCGHHAAIGAMAKFRIGLIPFKQTQLTASVDPIKYYEYRSLGLPVISTRFGEMARRRDDPGVFLVDNRTDLTAAVDSAKSYRMSFADIEQFRATNSWHSRFASAGILS
jgi:glycosyltransferase involved in cell wall biosynthesis